MCRSLRALPVALAIAAAGCGSPWNNPYPASERGANVLYSSFRERPKHLDPVQSYSSNEYALIANIYMPPLQYHYLKRPYELTPLAASEVPRPAYFDANGQPLPEDAPAAQIAHTVYEVRIKPGFKYQPHPAFATGAGGEPVYGKLTARDLRDVWELRDFEHAATREVVADDYVYQIKRLAHPRLHSPIFGLMAEYIVGLREYAERLQQAARAAPQAGWLDLRGMDIAGVRSVDRYTYRIQIKGKYPQFVYWLAMPFFAPVPVEADRFYSQPGMAEKNFSLDWYPVGSGPYMLAEHDPNRRMVLERNPHFPGEPYPSEGEPGDRAAGLLRDAGRTMPFIDRVVLSLEKEEIPYWNKFLQGYYDASGITSDTFDQVIQAGGTGDPQLTRPIRDKGIQLRTSVAAATYYMGFNMLDPVVGGASERARKLRRAISLAIDQEEFISIFLNGRGIPAQGPLPPGIFGYVEGEAGVNRYVYDWIGGAPQRKPIEEAKRLLAEAGYRNGIDRTTGKPLTLYFDSTSTSLGEKARSDWLIKQFQKIDVQLVMRATDYNRFQEKLRKGSTQLYYLGWFADYPDPENFLFLLFGPQSKVAASGENASNFSHPDYDRLFVRMREMENGPERQALVNRMVEILRHEAPWAAALHPMEFGLAHRWVVNGKPNNLANNALKYQRLDPALRDALRAEWNRPVLWPIGVALALLVLALLPGVAVYRRRERAGALG